MFIRFRSTRHPVEDRTILPSIGRWLKQISLDAVGEA